MTQQMEAPSVRPCDMTELELADENARKARLYDEAVKVARKVWAHGGVVENPVSTALWALSSERSDLRRIVERGRLELAGHALNGCINRFDGWEGKTPMQIAVNAVEFADATLAALRKAEAGPATDADRPDPQTEGGGDGVKSST